jgi:hypothetical protein
MSFLSMRVVIDHHQVGTKNCSGGGGGPISISGWLCRVTLIMSLLLVGFSSCLELLERVECFRLRTDNILTTI